MVKRELGHPGDPWLLRLERMRILDMMHSWSVGTTGNYQAKLGQLMTFEAAHPGLDFMRTPTSLTPSKGREIGIMWAQLHHSVIPLTKPGRRPPGSTPTYGALRQLRSAAGQYLGWNAIHAQPNRGTYFQDRRLLTGRVRATDTAPYELFARGFKARLGNESVPSTALLGKHIRGLDRFFTARYLAATTDSQRTGYAMAGLANLVLWTTWLRGGEAFNLTWGDVQIIWPQEAPLHDLPAGTGALLLRLTPETKTNRNATADVIVALRTMTGLDLSVWLRRVLRVRQGPPRATDPLFGTSRRRWTSHHYRTNYLYPGLEFLRASGDTFLQALGSDTGTTARATAPRRRSLIPMKFYSLHSYRRGARTYCERSQGTEGHRKATKDQIYEHARWERARSNQPIDVQYREWTYYRRLRITIYSH